MNTKKNIAVVPNAVAVKPTPCEVSIAVKSSGVDKTYGKLSESMAELGEITNLAVARGKFVGSKNYVLPLHEKTFKDFDEAPPIKETFVVSVTK